MATKVRFGIQERNGSEWCTVCTADTFEEILYVWERDWLPIHEEALQEFHATEAWLAENSLPAQGWRKPEPRMSRDLRVARMTPNAITIVDMWDHSQAHRLAVNKARLRTY